MSTSQRLDVTFTVTWESGWHVGSGFGTALADRLVRRRAGVPFVPGSQVKGVLRHHCERLAAALDCPVLSPHATDEDQQIELVEHFAPLERSALLVDRLFGTRYQGECLFVSDAVPPARFRRTKRTELRTRTALDRVTGTVKERHLFVIEVTEPTSPDLTGRIQARHPAGVLTPYDGGFPYEYALLLAALLSLESFGGDKSVGLGRCRLGVTEDTVTWNGQALPVLAALASFTVLGEMWTGFLNDERGVRT